ncbi:hypothetical protein CU048_11365 [Beijerinckiaceae bacterium]|nr:hypothetical protein CU048_11365 [Beijerinckiaceae bacterium]
MAAGSMGDHQQQRGHCRTAGARFDKAPRSEDKRQCAQLCLGMAAGEICRAKFLKSDKSRPGL